MGWFFRVFRSRSRSVLSRRPFFGIVCIDPFHTTDGFPRRALLPSWRWWVFQLRFSSFYLTPFLVYLPPAVLALCLGVKPFAELYHDTPARAIVFFVFSRFHFSPFLMVACPRSRGVVPPPLRYPWDFGTGFLVAGLLSP